MCAQVCENKLEEIRVILTLITDMIMKNCYLMCWDLYFLAVLAAEMYVFSLFFFKLNTAVCLLTSYCHPASKPCMIEIFASVRQM